MHIGACGREFALNRLAAAQTCPDGLRRRLLRWCGIEVPADGGIRERFFIAGRDLRIGGGTWINRGCHFDCRGPVEIGENCNLGPGVMVLTSTHVNGDETRRAGGAICEAVAIGDGTWIGARATVLPGVTIARGCVIAAGAVVHRDTEPDGLYAGVPAVRVRDLPRRGAALAAVRRRSSTAR
jgi:maltose O-acetyltransferase